MRRLAILLALLAPAAASASDGLCSPPSERYLPAAQSGYANTPDGVQARYDAGRDLVEAVLAAGPRQRAKRALRADLLARGRAQVARAEALDRADGFRSAWPLAPLPGVGPGYGLRRPDADARAAASPPWPLRTNGAVGVWIHELGSGRVRGLPGRTRASRPPRRSSSACSPPALAPRLARSAAAGGTTSARSASGRRTSPRTGSPAASATRAIGDGLRRLGMTSSTYPGRTVRRLRGVLRGRTRA